MLCVGRAMGLQINMHVYFGFAFFFIWPKARPFASFPSTVHLEIVDSCQRTWTNGVCACGVRTRGRERVCRSVVCSVLCCAMLCTVCCVLCSFCVHFKRIWYVRRFSIISRANDVEVNWLVYASSRESETKLRFSSFYAKSTNFDYVQTEPNDNFVVFRLHHIPWLLESVRNLDTLKIGSQFKGSRNYLWK